MSGGIYCQEGILNEETMALELDQKHPIVCSVLPGDFTKTGHFIILTDYEDGKVSVLDPFSKANTRQWVFEDIEDQIQEMWVYWKE